MDILEFLNKYSNLLLIGVTTVYVVLTWRIVKEARQTREDAMRPELVATLVPLGAHLIKLRIYNAGGGPAKSVEVDVLLKPSNTLETHTWRHPVLLPGGFEDMKIPTPDNVGFYLDQL